MTRLAAGRGAVRPAATRSGRDAGPPGPAHLFLSFHLRSVETATGEGTQLDFRHNLCFAIEIGQPLLRTRASRFVHVPHPTLQSSTYCNWLAARH